MHCLGSRKNHATPFRHHQSVLHHVSIFPRHPLRPTRRPHVADAHIVPVAVPVRYTPLPCWVHHSVFRRREIRTIRQRVRLVSTTPAAILPLPFRQYPRASIHWRLTQNALNIRASVHNRKILCHGVYPSCVILEIQTHTRTSACLGSPSPHPRSQQRAGERCACHRMRADRRPASLHAVPQSIYLNGMRRRHHPTPCP